MASADDLNQHNVVIPTQDPKTLEEEDQDRLDGADVVDIDDLHDKTLGGTDNKTISEEIDEDEKAVQSGELDEELENELLQKSSTA